MGRPPSFLLSLGAVDFPRYARFILGWICLAISGTRRNAKEGGCGGNVIYKLLDPREAASEERFACRIVTDKSPRCPRSEFSSDRFERMDALPPLGTLVSILSLCLLFVREYGIRDEACPSAGQKIDAFPSPSPCASNIYIPSFFFFFNILDISRIIYSKLMYKLRVAPHANILEICCNPVDEFHLWLMYINITRCVTLNGQ